MKKLTTTSILLFAVFLSFGQSNNTSSNTTKTPSKHFIGMSAGGVTGLGFSYRYWPTKWGIQLTGIPVFFQNKSGNFTSIGLSAMYTFKDNKIVDLYGYVGNQLLSVKQVFSYVDGNGNLTKNEDKSSVYNVGTGFGFKFDFLESLDFNVQGGYGVYGIGNKNFSPFTTLTAELGLYYHL